MSKVWLWWRTLEPAADEWVHLARTLDAEEWRRTYAFATPELGRRFAAARGWLRELLGRQIGRPAASLVFAAAANGKPFLVDSPRPIAFNVSHSGNRALIAICETGSVGVDIEAHREFAFEEVTAGQFSSAEQEEMARVPVERRAAFFMSRWTCKEAIAKCVGTGVSIGLANVHIDECPRFGDVRWRWLGDAEGAPREIFLRALDAGEGWSAAAAYAGESTPQWVFPESFGG